MIDICLLFPQREKDGGGLFYTNGSGNDIQRSKHKVGEQHNANNDDNNKSLVRTRKKKKEETKTLCSSKQRSH